MRAGVVGDAAHYRWSSYRAKALGEADARLTPHGVYLALSPTPEARRAAYRALFRSALDGEAIDDIRLALNQGQPLGNARFYTQIQQVTGEARAPRARGRSAKAKIDSKRLEGEQQDFGF